MIEFMVMEPNSGKPMQQRWRRLVLEQALTAARERRAIASDLHDHVGQALAMVKQKLLRLHGDVLFYGLDSQVVEIRRLVEEIIKYTRNLTAEISPPVLYELGLLPAIEWLTEKFGPQNRIGISLSLPQEIPGMNLDIQETLFRALRELLANVAKHASATKVEVRLALQDKNWRLTVHDDGCGFDPSVVAARSKTGDGFGLFNLKVLMRGLGGTMEIAPDPVRGTRVTLVVPTAEPIAEKESR